MIPTRTQNYDRLLGGVWEKAMKEELREASGLRPVVCPLVSGRALPREICNPAPAADDLGL